RNARTGAVAGLCENHGTVLDPKEIGRGDRETGTVFGSIPQRDLGGYRLADAGRVAAEATFDVAGYQRGLSGQSAGDVQQSGKELSARPGFGKRANVFGVVLLAGGKNARSAEGFSIGDRAPASVGGPGLRLLQAGGQP